MKRIFAATCVIAGLSLTGCATKNYVRNTAAPIQAKVDQVGDQTSKNSQQIETTNGQVTDVDERAQRGISAAREQAGTAIQDAADASKQAADARSRADQAAQASDDNKRDLGALKDQVANIDDYKLQTSVSALFKFNQATLTPEAEANLDNLATQVQSDKHFVIAVEGYTDKSGNKVYNEELSQKRAEAVVAYLVAKHDIPIYKIHMVGLGEENPVDSAKTRDARARNRRVEVKVFTAGENMAAMNSQE